MSSGPVMTSPDRDLATRILERAKMAQMTRKLKLGLSQVPTNSNGNNDNKINMTLQGTNLDQPDNRKRVTTIPQDDKDTSPLKKHSVNGIIKNTTSLSPIKDKFIKPKSPLKNKELGSTPIIKIPSTPGRSSSNHQHTSNTTNNNIQTTPKRKITKIPGISHHDDNDNTNHATGADLLIYLATSPYTKNESHSNTRIKVPTTPRSSTFGQLHPDDTIRLSHLKPSLTSPQSTLKNINHHHHHGDLLNGNGNGNSNATMSFNDILLESPSLYNNNGVNSHLSVGNSNNNNNNNNNINTNGINANLLKTPNFNMGDYIHNLFSPSPNISLTNVTKERNIKRNSINNNSLAQVALLSTSGINKLEGDKLEGGNLENELKPSIVSSDKNDHDI